MMNDSEWNMLWDRIRGRWPKWGPSMVEESDWKRELRNNDPLLVEAATSAIIAKYSSREPTLAWVIRALNEITAKRRSENFDSRQETEKDRLLEIERLEQDEVRRTDVGRLRTLLALSPEEIQTLIKRLAAMGVATERLGDDPSDWSLTARGFAIALINLEEQGLLVESVKSIV